MITCLFLPPPSSPPRIATFFYLNAKSRRPTVRSSTPCHHRAFGDLPGVRIVQSSHVGASSLVADKHCGEGTKLIHYMHPGELLSREITFKDTHSPRGELLVVHNDEVQATAPVLGFNSPMFGPDIVLPAKINERLREMVVKGHSSEEQRAAQEGNDEYAVVLLNKFPGISVPQVRAVGIWRLKSGSRCCAGTPHEQADFVAGCESFHCKARPPQLFLNQVAVFQTISWPYLITYAAICHPDVIAP